MTHTLPQPLHEELRQAGSWRERVDLASKEAGRLALRGKLSIESKLSELNALQAEASERLDGARGELHAGWESVRDRLAEIWSQCGETYEGLQRELRKANEDAEKNNPSEARRVSGEEKS